jgi:hypothetical protein
MNRFLMSIVLILFITSCEDNTVDLYPSISFSDGYFTVINKDDFNYNNVEFTVNGNYKTTLKKFESKETIYIPMRDFANKEGVRLNNSIKPKTFSIWCDLDNDKNGYCYAELD